MKLETLYQVLAESSSSLSSIIFSYKSQFPASLSVFVKTPTRGGLTVIIVHNKTTQSSPLKWPVQWFWHCDDGLCLPGPGRVWWSHPAWGPGHPAASLTSSESQVVSCSLLHPLLVTPWCSWCLPGRSAPCSPPYSECSLAPSCGDQAPSITITH